MFFQAGVILGVVVGGYTVHQVHKTLNKKPLNKLKNKLAETKEVAAAKLTSARDATVSGFNSFAEKYGFKDTPPKE